MNNTKQDIKNCFQLKADFFPITVFKILSYNPVAIREQLNNTINNAPKYFYYAPMIIDVNDLDADSDELNLKELCELLREKKIIPVGVRGINEQQEKLAKEYGLAKINLIKTVPNFKPKEDTPKNTTQTTKVITKPIRSGTRVYAKNADLIVLSSINAGGECIADGNIHVYGPLRGRVLAGASGNVEARIFCKNLDAELISIAGHYLLNEEMKFNKTNSLVQIYLKNKGIQIESI